MSEKQKLVKLPGGRMKPADYLVTRYAVRVPINHTLEDILNPHYFLNEAGNICRARDKGPVILTVISDDEALDVELLVTAAKRTEIITRVRQIFSNPEQPEKSEDNARFKAKFAPRTKWRILDGDKEAAKGMEKQDCHEWVDALNAGERQVSDIPADYAA